MTSHLLSPPTTCKNVYEYKLLYDNILMTDGLGQNEYIRN